jgi:hypothetical protein
MLGLRQIPFDFGQGRGNRRRQPFFHAIVEKFSTRVGIETVIVLPLTGYKLGPTPFRKHNSECLERHAAFLRDQLVKGGYDL